MKLTTLAALMAGAVACASPALAEDKPPTPIPTCTATELQAIINCYSPSKPNWHEYQVPSFELCNQRQNPNCTRELVKDAFLRNVMPCQDPKIKVTHGIMLNPRAPTPVGCTHDPGHVIIHLHEGVGVIAVSIRTHTDHELHDGVVLRYLEEKQPGVFTVYTRGIGNNRSWFWKTTNQQIGPIVFKAQNKNMKKYVEEQLRRLPQPR